MASKGLLTLIAGAAVGAAVGLLYAPESGVETRRKLQEQAKKAKNDIDAQARKTYGEVTEKATEVKGTVSERLDSALSSASYKADEAITALEKKLQQLRSKNAQYQKPTTANEAMDTAEAKVNGTATV
ncbi:MAG: YtxH domain-containing protein [Nonlabens sp.]